MAPEITIDETMLERLAKATGDLPSMPDVVEKVLRMAQDPESDVAKLQQVIEKDPGLTTRVLRVANSAYYHRSREIGSLSHAILTLGFKTLVSITVASSTKTIFDQYSEVTRKVRTTLWDHSITTAFLTGPICEMAKKQADPELCFLGGLLHDIGKLVISRNFPTQFTKVRHAVEEKGAEQGRAEDVFLKFRHEHLGAFLAREWQLPQAIEHVIHFHHNFEEAPEKEINEAAIVALADSLSTMLGWNFDNPTMPPLAEHPAGAFLGIDCEKVEGELEELKALVESLREMF